MDYADRAWSKSLLGNTDEAESHFQQALELVEQSDDPDLKEYIENMMLEFFDTETDK
jgi:hypothetical protein